MLMICQMAGLSRRQGGYAGPADPSFPAVSLLVQPTVGDATHARDATGKTLTLVGAATIVFGGPFASSKCISTAGAGGSYLSAGNAAGFSFAGDYTVEALIRGASGMASTLYSLVGVGDNLTVGKWGLAVNYDTVGGASPGALTHTAKGSAAGVSGAYAMTDGVWYYVHAARTGTTLTLSAGPIGGSLSTGIASATISGTVGPTTGSADLRIGADGEAWKGFNGKIAAVRITNGVARTAAIPTGLWPTY